MGPRSKKRKTESSADVSAAGDESVPSTEQKTSSRRNPGGASTLKWFNPLLDRADLKFILDDLFAQLSASSRVELGSSTDVTAPCIIFHKETNRPKKERRGSTSSTGSADSTSSASGEIGGQPVSPASTSSESSTDSHEVPLEHPRIQPSLKTVTKLKDKHPLFASLLPVKINASHAALLRAGRHRPNELPPNCPQDWFKSLFGRLANEAEAKWVASHLCHRKDCVEPTHIIWEPGWYNRARDNCPGRVVCNTCKTESTGSCTHIPQCIRAHRAPPMDWTKLEKGRVLEGESAEDINKLFSASKPSASQAAASSGQALSFNDEYGYESDVALTPMKEKVD